MTWSDTYKKKLLTRVDVYQASSVPGGKREVIRELCKRDKLFFINNFLWTYDPRPDRKPNHFPFITYPFQDEFIRWRDERFAKIEDGMIEKCRDMGMTWMFLAWDLHQWLFSDSFNALLGSRKEDLVDTYDDPNCLFWKLDYMISKLPEWLKPAGYNKEKHRKLMLLINPVNNNSISGESSNPEFSRQGRYTVIDMDEFAFWDNSYTAWTATGSSTRCRFAISTPNGMNNKFADLRFNSPIKIFTAKWQEHPLKDDAWREKEASRLTPKELAQEIDLDYKASGGDMWLPLYRVNASNIELFDPINPVPDYWNLYGSIDQHSKNPSSCHIYGIDLDGCVYAIDERYEGESHINDVADFFVKHPLYKRLKWITADPSLWTKDQNVRQGLKSFITSRAELLIERGIEGRLLVPGTKGNDLLARDLVNNMIVNKKLKISPLCKSLKWEFGEALHWATQSETLAMTKNSKEALADKNNHAWDDFKYFITKNPEIPKADEVPMVEHSLAWYEKMEELQRKNKRRDTVFV
jgi:hypothetical protein